MLSDNRVEALEHPVIQAKLEVLSPPPFQDYDDDDEDGEEELDEDAADELPDDVDPNSGAHFFRITEEDRVQNQSVVHRTVKELYEMVVTNKLNRKPEYQRDEVWTKSRQQGLIDSLFKGCPIPAIVLAAQKNADGTEYFNVIDGKQRLTTITKFMRGKLAYKDKLSTMNKEFRYIKCTDADVKAHFVVPIKDKQYFEQRQIICVEHYDLPVAQEEDIFKRIQQGMTLVTGEKSSVGNTPRKSFIKNLAADYLSIGKHIPLECDIDISRGRPFTNMASFVFCVENLPDERVYPTPQARGTWMDHQTNTASDSLQTRCKAAMNDFVEIATKYQKPFVMLQKRVAPVEFVFIAIYLYITHDANITFEQRAEEILSIRRDTHSAFPGIVKSNAKLYDFLWKQLENYASRPENGYERLELLGEPELTRVKLKSKAKVGRKQKKEKASGLHIEFDHRMDIDPLVSSSSQAPEGNKRPIDALASVPYGEPSPKRQKPTSPRGPRETQGVRS